MIKLQTLINSSYLKFIKGNTDSKLIFYLIIQNIYNNLIINLEIIKKSILEVISDITTNIADICSLNFCYLYKIYK